MFSVCWTLYNVNCQFVYSIAPNVCAHNVYNAYLINYYIYIYIYIFIYKTTHTPNKLTN